ncbi:MAG TPA: hypothetical protein VFJ04_03890 [Rhodanobacteraceae bacterium]|jgi:hypothetical protein|nr:hypothetical protein [Rhodanobacteraceae bacterium]
MFYGLSPLWIPLIAIIGYFAYRIFDSHNRSRGHGDIRRVIEDNTATSKQVLAKLESLEARVAGVEKTLNDIPS